MLFRSVIDYGSPLDSTLSDNDKLTIKQILILAKTKKAYKDSLEGLVRAYSSDVGSDSSVIKTMSDFDQSIESANEAISEKYDNAIHAINNCQNLMKALQFDIHSNIVATVNSMTQEPNIHSISNSVDWLAGDINEYRRFYLSYFNNLVDIPGFDKDKQKVDMLGLINANGLTAASQDNGRLVLSNTGSAITYIDSYYSRHEIGRAHV